MNTALNKSANNIISETTPKETAERPAPLLLGVEVESSSEGAGAGAGAGEGPGEKAGEEAGEGDNGEGLGEGEDDGVSYAAGAADRWQSASIASAPDQLAPSVPVTLINAIMP